MRITLDKSDRDVVALCVDCPPWRELRGTRAAALTAAAAHVDQVHADPRAAALLRERARHAERRNQSPKPG